MNVNEQSNQTVRSGLKGWSKNEQDLVFTPDKIAEFMVNYFNPKGAKLEPCKGKGVFLKYMPDAEWCEIEEGRDFFNYNKKVDWIITNPPYSIYDKFLDHCFHISANVVFLVPLNKVMNNYTRIKKYYQYGGIVEILVTTGSKLGFPFGFPCCIIHFKKGYKGDLKFNPDLLATITKYDKRQMTLRGKGY